MDVGHGGNELRDEDVRLLVQRVPLLRADAGLGLVEHAPPLKRMFMAEARGEAGALPRLLQGMDV